MIYLSHFPAQKLACPGAHYRPHARLCATRDGRPFGTRYLVTTQAGRQIVLTKYDVCGTAHRIDVPTGLFVQLVGRDGLRRGIVPVTCRVLEGGSWTGTARRGRHRR